MNGQSWRVVRSLLAHRQPATGYMVALAFLGAAIDLAVAAAGDQLSSFSRFSRREFDGDVVWRGFAELGHASALAWAVVLLAIPALAVLSGWLRACYLAALADGTYSLRAPRRTIVQLSLYSLLAELIGLGLAALADHDQASLALLLLLASTPITFFSDYAIALDGLSLIGGVRRSLRIFRLHLRVSIVAAIALLFVAELFALAFSRGFTDSTHVQPPYLASWLLVGVLLAFVTDVVLLTLYRATRISAGGSGDPSAGRDRPGASG